MISDVRKLLPIGSVVVLDGGVKSLMITGVMQTDMQDSLHPVDFDIRRVQEKYPVTFGESWRITERMFWEEAAKRFFERMGD